MDSALILGKGHFDRNNPLSLQNKLGPHWAGRLIGKLAELPGVEELLGDESVLKDWLYKHHSYRGGGTDHRYRLQFWLEYENCCRMNRVMNMANVYNLAGTESTFINLVMKDPCRVAWMLCRPVSYEANTREILATGMERLKKALEVDPFADPNKPDLKLLNIQLQITKMFDLRLHGAPTQKIQELSIKATMDANGDIQALVDQGDAKSLQQRIYDLQQRKRKAEGRGSLPGDREAAPSPSEPAENTGTTPQIEIPEIKDAEVVE